MQDDVLIHIMYAMHLDFTTVTTSFCLTGYVSCQIMQLVTQRKYIIPIYLNEICKGCISKSLVATCAILPVEDLHNKHMLTH